LIIKDTGFLINIYFSIQNIIFVFGSIFVSNQTALNCGIQYFIINFANANLFAIIIYKIYISLKLSFRKNGDGIIQTVATNILDFPNDDNNYSTIHSRISVAGSERKNEILDKKNLFKNIERNLEKNSNNDKSSDNSSDNNVDNRTINKSKDKSLDRNIEILASEVMSDKVNPKIRKASIFRRKSIFTNGMKMQYNTPDGFLRRKILLTVIRCFIISILYEIGLFIFSLFVALNGESKYFEYDYEKVKMWSKSCPNHQLIVIINLCSLTLIYFMNYKLGELIKSSSVFMELYQFQIFFKYISWIFPITNVCNIC